MRKRVMFTILALALVLAIAIPASAPTTGRPAWIEASKDVTDPLLPNIYYIGDTINYIMKVRNPEGNVADNTLVEIWDTLPDGTIHYFIEEGVDPPLFQEPGDEQTYFISYTVDEADIEWLETGIGDFWGVKNRFEARGHDSLGDDISVLVTKNSRVIRPDTDVTIVASETTVYPGDEIDLTVTEENTGFDEITNVSVEVRQNGTLIATLTAPPESGDLDDDGVLDAGEIWSWTIEDVEITDTTTFEVLGFGLDPLDNEVSYAAGYEDERDEVTVAVIDPDTEVTIMASETTVVSGDSVDLTITEENTGDVPLTEPYVEVRANGTLIATLVAPPDSGDLDADGVLDPGEIWTWTITDVEITDTTTFVALGFGTDPLGNEISFEEGYLGERDEVTVHVEEITVTKTVDTSFERTHEWEIDKWVETENEEFVNGTPKIWLVPDESGDEWATWNVCVTYLGFADHDHNVSGTVTITNTGTADAVITEVVDLLCGEEIDILWDDDEDFEFPYTLAPGDSLVGSYSEDIFCDEFNVVTVTTTVDQYTSEQVDVVWGDPDEEHLDVVTIEDDSEFLAQPLLGTLDAADLEEGDEVCFDYDHFFAWEDFSTPGPHIYENTAEIVETGQTAEATLVVNWLDEELTVTKTVETYFERTHEWDIDKWVETEFGHVINEDTPKIWLVLDESGDEWATWNVCVTYMGFEDHNHNVSGTITITNTGTADVVITEVVDELCGVEIDIDWPAGTEFPYTLGPGQSLVGTYSEDVFCDEFNVVTVTTTVDQYSTSEPVVWGDPDEEHLDVVTIEDDSEFLAQPLLGTLDAADLDEGQEVCFDYDHFFAWADFSAPGPHIFENTATIVQTGQSADAILVVNWEEEFPDTQVTINASAIWVVPGDSVDLTITESNTGDVPLTNVYVEVWQDGVHITTLDETHPSWSSSINMDDILDVGETWTWTIDSGPITECTEFVAYGFGTDPLGNEISFEEGYLGERDEVTVCPEPVVGGQALPVNKLGIVIAWAGIFAAMISGASLLALKRRRASRSA